ncbi:hypothetical protein HYH03_001235 [Edaphochlamys debaryana]|uniref:SRCR domain-containing protein n=1 Tax=Edaphochlamys debaryana TaxID=47281 RepID=A0A835YMZ8_9CHLO|nr:hypothetical protein HYH03_001235 [Edaphochlamys debaryana]|eukprot:KAG2501455.1 hypothetical protein HYH03_001235 [Edaphochlamys debaryana]
MRLTDVAAEAELEAEDGALTLVNLLAPDRDPKLLEGVLLVQHSGEWRPVCDDGFGAAEAYVACGQLLGFPEWYGPGNAGEKTLNEFWFTELPPPWLDQVACTGNETRLVDCAHAAWGVTDCEAIEAVALSCPKGPKPPPAPPGNSLENSVVDAGAGAASSRGVHVGTEPAVLSLNASGIADGELRLVGGSTPSEGRLEVAYRQQWGTVCGFMFGPEDARVACRALGLPHEGAQVLDARVFSQLGTPGDLGNPAQAPPIWLGNLGCSGTETSLAQCPSNGWGVSGCTHLQNVGLRCAAAASSGGGTATSDSQAGPTRLRLDSPPSGGRVAGVVELLHEGTWGRICLTPATTAATYAVLCRELGYAAEGAAPEPGLSRDLKHRTSYRPFWLADVACGGGEASVRHCRSLGWGAHSCDPLGFHEQPLALSCALPAGADGSGSPASTPALATPPVIPPPARTGANETAVCAVTLIGRGSAEELSQASAFGEDSQLLSASLHCRTASGAPLPVAAGKRLADLLNITAGSHSGVSLTQRMQTGNDTALDEEWGLTFSGLEALALVDSVVRDIRLSRAGPLLQFVDCATLALTNVTLTRLYGAKVYKPIPVPTFDENGIPTGLNVTDCRITGNTVAYGGFHGTSWYDNSVSSLRFADDDKACVREHVGGELPSQCCRGSSGRAKTSTASGWSMVTLVKHTRALRNSAARDGGFMYNALSTLVYLADHSQMAHNEATCNGGGAIKSDCYQSPTFAVVPDVRLILESGAAVINNSAGGSGGALDVAWTGVAVIVVRLQSMLSGNTARGLGGGGAVKVWAAFYMLVQATNDSQVSYNTAELGDGGAFMATGVSLNTEDTDAFYRSQLYVEFQNNTEICGNRALGGGGGGAGRFNAFLTNTLVVYRSSVADNYAQADGGAFSVEPRAAGDYRLEVHSSQVSGNACGVEGFLADGGAFAVQNKGTVTVRNSTFSRNRASGEGGALRVLGFCSNLSIASSAFDSNSAGKAGGVLSIQHPGLDLLEVLHTRMANNSATIGGGALALVGTYAGAAVLWNTTIEGSRAGVADGGAVNWQVRIPDAHPLAGGTLRSPLLNLTATTLRNNQASFGQGGGLFVRPRAPTLATNGTGPRPNMTILIRDGSRFEGNTAAGSGAGLNLLASRQELDVFVAVDQSWFVSNRAGDSVSSVTGSGASGGGISMGYTGSVDAGSPSACGLLVSRSTFYGNRCGGGGGGALVLTSCVANVTRSTFSANTASYEGGAISLAEEETLKAPGGAVNSNLTAEFPWGPGEDEGAKRRRLASAALYGAPYVPYGLDGLPYTLHVDSSSFMNCTSISAAGGAVYTRVRGLLRLASTKFISCSAGVYGGAVASAFSLLNATEQSIDASIPRLDISGGSFVANTANADGGALIVNWAGLLRVRQTRFEGNVAGYGDKGRGTGGAICMVVQAPQQPDVLRAYASGSGGGSSDASAVGGGRAIVLDVEGSAFTNNSCTSSETAGGGAIFAGFESTGLPANPLPLLVSLTGCELTGNTANGGSGGALFAAAWRQDQPTNTAPSGATLPPLSVQIRHCDVSRNSADQQGGAVKVIRPRTTASLELPPRLLLLNSSLADNRAGADGGALSAMLDGGQVEISASSLTGNLCTGQSGACGGGAAYIDSALAVAIQHTRVGGNQASMGGGLAVFGAGSAPASASSTTAAAATRRAATAAGTAAGQGTTLLLYGTVLYGNNASTSGGTHVPRGGAVYIDGAVAVALMNCDLTDNNDVNDADWGAALASTQTCLQELNGSNATLAESVPAAASLPWSGAVARSAVSTWALLERARDVGCWMLGLYDTLLPSHALGVLKLYLLDADNSTDTNLDLEQTASEDATGMPLYLTDTSASSLAVSCRPEDTGAATPSVVPASASGDVSQQLAAAEAGLWLVADSFLVGTGNASAPLLPARGELLLRALDDCRELSYITTFGEAQKDRMTSALQDKSIAYLGLAPNTLRLESIYATDGSVKVVRPFTGQANFSTASKAAVLEPAAKTGQITLQMGATYSIGVEMVDGLGERLTAAEGEYLVRVSIVPELPVWLSTVPSAVAWANSKNASSFASIEAFDLSVPLLRGLAIFDQVSLNGWPGYYFLSIRAESNSGNASGLAIQVPIYITPCNPGERLDLRWSLTSCIVCTDDQYSFWTDSRPDLQELIGEAMAQVGVTSESFTLAALGRVPGVVTERIQSWVVQEQSASICNNCPEGAYCPGGAAVVPLPGYWHSAANSTQMHLCPQSSACEGFWTDINVTAAGSNASAASTTRTAQAPAVRTSILENDPRVRGLRSCESLWYAQWPPGASVLADPSASQSDMEQGDSPTACLLWGVQAHHPNSYMQQQCADGFGGRACTVCQKGHFTTPEFECESCQSVDWSAALGVLQFMSSAVLGLYTVWTNLRESEGTKYGVVEGVEVERMTAGDVLKAALVHCQIFVTVTRLSMDWPPIIVQFQGVLRSASGAQSAFSYSPSCLFPEADAAEAARIQTLTGLIQPLLVIAMVGLVWAMRWLVFGREAWSTRKASAPVAEEDVPSADNLDEMPSARPSGEGSISERREPPLTTGEGGKAAQQAVAEGVEAAAGNDDPRAAGLAEPPASPDRPLADVSVHPRGGGGVEDSGVHLLHPPPRLVLETTAVTALPPPEGDEDGAASAAGLVSLGGEATTAGADVVDAVGPNRYSLEAVSPSTPMPLLDAMAAPHAWKPSHAPAARVGSGLLGRKPSLAPSSPARSFSGVGPSRLSQQPSFHGDAAFAPPPGSPRRNGRSSSAAGDRPANLTTALQQPMIAIPGSPARASRDDAAVTAAAGFKVQDFDDVTDHGGGQESPQQEPQEQQQTRLLLLPQSTAAGNRIGGIAGAERSVHSPRASASLFPTRTVSEAGAGRAASPSLRHDSALRHQASTGRQPSVNGGEGSFRSDSAVDGKAAVSRAAPARKDGQGKGEAPEGLDGEDGTENEEGRDGDGESTEGKGDQKPRKKHMMIDTILSLPRQLCVVVFVVVFILYSTWSQAALSIFACYRLDDGSGPYPELQQATSDSGYWMTNMDLACYAGEHATLYVPVGIVAVLLVCAGPPIASAILLYLHRDKLHLKKTQLVYGFLYTRYKRRWWWWESVVQLQMLALVVVDVFGRALSLTQQAIVMLLSMSVISAINVACAPLSHPALILLDFASMAVLSSTVLLGLFAADSRKASDDTIIGAVIVSINVMLLAAFVGLIIYCSRSALQSVVTASRRVRQALGSARARVSGHISLRAGLRRRRRSKVAHTPSMGSMAANDA